MKASDMHKMQFNPCCDMRCLVFNCPIERNGGCYHVCRLRDSLRNLESIQSGNTICINPGMVYFPDTELAQKYLANLSQDQKNYHQECINNIPIRLKEIEEVVNAMKI